MLFLCSVRRRNEIENVVVVFTFSKKKKKK